MMTRWDSSHERYFNCLAALSFDKAKELLVGQNGMFSRETRSVSF